MVLLANARIHERVPRAPRLNGAGFRFFAARRRRHADKVVAVRALKLAAHDFFRRLDVLVAMRAGEFEFVHGFGFQFIMRNSGTETAILF